MWRELGVAARQYVGDYGPAVTAGLVGVVALGQPGLGAVFGLGAVDEERIEAGGGEDGS